MRIRTYTFLTLCLFLAAACGGGGGGGNGSGPNPPPAPNNITAVGEHKSISVNWALNPSVDGYNVYWGTSPGVGPATGTKVSGVLPPSRILGLENGTTYYAVVTAYDDGVESSASAEASASAVATIPTRVRGVAAVPGDAEATVEWTDQYDADSYIVIVNGGQAGGSGQRPDAISPFTVTGLTNGATYDLSVVAINEAGQGTGSQSAEATPTAPVPGWTPQLEVNTPFPNNMSYSAQLFLRDAAINDNGVAAVAWSSKEGFSGGIVRTLINHTADGGWAEQATLGATGGDAWVTVTPGNAVHAAYTENGGMWMRHYKDSEWSVRRRVGPAPNNAGVCCADIASDADGNVFAIWLEGHENTMDPAAGRTNQVWVSRYDATTESWSNSEMLSHSVGLMRYTAIAASAPDLVFATWTEDTRPYEDGVQGGGPRQRIVYASIFDGSVWQPGEIVGTNNNVDDDTAEQIALDVNDTGHAAVLWMQKRAPAGIPDGHSVDIVRYDPLLGQWSAPEVIVPAGFTRGIYPEVVVYPSDDMLTAWRKGTTGIVGSSAFDSATGIWLPAADLPLADMSTADHYGLEKTSAGETLLAWSNEWGGPRSVQVRRLAPGASQWGEPDVLGGRVGSDMRFRVSANGHAIVVTRVTVFQYNDQYQILYGATYTPP